jgi:cytochrome c biogenesis protein CcmG/thiol:disulfide interchange protein DsbE
LLVREVADRFPGRVEVRVEDWGDSSLARRLGVTRYPAVFVGDTIFATPQDLGFYGQAKAGRYTPWRDPANHERFRLDLVKLVERSLAGEALPPGRSGAAEPSLAALPDLRVTDLEGRTLATAALRGKPLLVEFWATWCEPCRRTLPYLSALQARHGEALAVIGFAVESEEKDVREMAGALAPGLRTAVGTPEIARAFGDLLAVPTLFLFDDEGRAVAAFYGEPPDLHAQVEAALAPVLKRTRALPN